MNKSLLRAVFALSALAGSAKVNRLVFPSPNTPHIPALHGKSASESPGALFDFIFNPEINPIL